jgi:hypothetical protein
MIDITQLAMDQVIETTEPISGSIPEFGASIDVPPGNRMTVKEIDVPNNRVAALIDGNDRNLFFNMCELVDRVKVVA